MLKTPMTILGHRTLSEELQRLKTVERRRVAQAIEVARAHGDISENAEYDAAKNEQGLLEAKITDIEGKLATAQVIDISTLSGETIIFGATVTLLDMDSDETKKITIVGEDESNVEKGLISFSSPLARGLIGKSVGDFVTVTLPSSTKEYEVQSVEFKYF